MDVKLLRIQANENNSKQGRKCFVLKAAFILIAGFIFLLTNANAQQYILRGQVVDSISQEPMQGVTVTINYGEIKLATDSNGEFETFVEGKEVNLLIHSIGYLAYRKRIDMSMDQKLRIALRIISKELETITVIGQSDKILDRTIGLNSLNIKTIAKLPTVLGEVDILKSIQMLPGVSSVGEASSGVNIRGGTTDQSLFIIDDMPIYNPTHMFGLFSAFPSEAVSSFDLYKGNVPVRYGGRAAAVVDIKLANPTTDKFKMKGGISLVSEKLQINAPIIKDRLGIIVSGRASYNDFLFPLISKQLKNTKARFWDNTAKVYLKISSKQTLNFSTYHSHDFFQTQLLGTIDNINASSTQFQYDTHSYALKWFIQTSQKSNLQLSAINTNYQPNILLPEVNSKNIIKLAQDIDYKKIKANFNYYLGSHTLELGADIIKHTINPGQLLSGGSNSVSEIAMPHEYGIESALSAQDNFTLFNKISAEIGLRYTQYFFLGPNKMRYYETESQKETSSLVNEKTLRKGQVGQTYGGAEPRVGISYALNKNSNIKIGYNLARQYNQIISNTATPIPTSRWKLADNNIKPQVSQLFSAGYFRTSKNTIYEFSVEAYYRRTKNAIDYKPGASFLLNSTPETEVLQGKNQSYGLELMATKKKGEVTGWVNYTYARSKNLINEGSSPKQQINQGNWYPANYDRPHTINAIAVINQGQHHDFSFIFTYSTGRPYTTPQGYIRYENQVLPFYFVRNNSRIPDYHRLDFAWNIYNPKIRNGKFKGNFAFTIYNLYGRKNAYSVFLKQDLNYFTKPYRLVIYGSPIVSLSYKFTFNSD